MIVSLHIEHYALIDQLDIKLHKGFSVITGETGAGKSIILGAIGLLLGGRADVKAIKTGEKRCVIEAMFDLSNYHMDDFFTANDLDFDGSECIIRREVSVSGKSRAFINDTPVTVAQLKELGEELIDVHSQHQNLLLGKENFQLNILDILAQDVDLQNSYAKLFAAYREACRQLAEAEERAKHVHDEEDYIRFQANQLAEADLQEGEQTALEDEQELLSHAEEVKENLMMARACLTSDDDTDLLQQLQQSETAVNSISKVYPKAEELAQRIKECYIELRDVADELEQEADRVEYDPERLQQVDERLNLLYTLQKKHHLDSVDALIDLQRELEERLALIDGNDELLENLRQQKEETHAAAMKQAEQLSQMRQQAATELQTKMEELLRPLGMPHVQFQVEFTRRQELDPSGIDKVAFLFSANKNIPVQPLSQIASGGEIARVMLSLKALIAGAVKLPTIIFDEIDTGVSGSIAEKMANIMQTMGEGGRQVISITHLPQIAALGRHHYKVFKEETLFSATSHIVELNDQQRVEEIAHMLSGASITEAALSNARELLKH